jgi:anti-sigma factor RsiW
MMTCRVMTQLLIDFVSGELPPEHHAQVEQHLQACPPCVAYLQTYQHTIRLARQLPCEPLPPELDQRLRAALADIDRA